MRICTGRDLKKSPLRSWLMIRLSPWNILDLENGVKKQKNKTEVKLQLKRCFPLAKATHWGWTLPLKGKVYILSACAWATGGLWCSARLSVPESAVVSLDLLQWDSVGALLELLHCYVVLLGHSFWTLQCWTTPTRCIKSIAHSCNQGFLCHAMYPSPLK